MARIPPWDHPHPVKGKRKDQWVARTFYSSATDPPVLFKGSQHYSLASAKTQFKRFLARQFKWWNVKRVWVEDRQGNVLFDSDVKT